uniref:Uncharacterized protein n=1 Tax=Vitis vinifera TaxID=29760 RepID=A5BRL9_VITVI|nr:hypothetical protein VITISV_005218 [Vitis vinifera]
MEKPSFGQSDVAEALTKINSTSHQQQMELLKTVVMNHTVLLCGRILLQDIAYEAQMSVERHLDTTNISTWCAHETTVLHLDSRSMCQRKTGEEQVSPSEFSPGPQSVARRDILRVSSAVSPEISFLSFGKARLDDSSSERQSKSPSESSNENEIPIQEKQRASSGLQNPSANTMGSFQLLRLFQFQTSAHGPFPWYVLDYLDATTVDPFEGGSPTIQLVAIPEGVRWELLFMDANST